SNDHGETWALTPNVKLPVTLKGGQRYDDVFFIDQHTGFLAFKESIFKTTDGGVSWTTVLTLSPSNPKHNASAYFHSIFFINALVGYAVGDFEKLFKTLDGGTTWMEVSWTGNTQPYISFTDVYFLDEQVGF